MPEIKIDFADKANIADIIKDSLNNYSDLMFKRQQDEAWSQNSDGNRDDAFQLKSMATNLYETLNINKVIKSEKEILIDFKKYLKAKNDKTKEYGAEFL